LVHLLHGFRGGNEKFAEIRAASLSTLQLHYKLMCFPCVIIKGDKQAGLNQPGSFSKTHIAIRYNLLKFLSTRTLFVVTLLFY